MQAISECRADRCRIDGKIADLKDEIRSLLKLRKKTEERLNLLLDEWTGRLGPSLFDGVPPVALPVSPASVATAEPEPDFVAKYNLTGWRALPITSLDLPSEVIRGVQEGIRPELRYLGFLADEIESGVRYGQTDETLDVIRATVQRLAGWRSLGVDHLLLKPKVETAIAGTGATTLGELADRLDQGDTLGLGARDLRDVRELINLVRADDEPGSASPPSPEPVGPLVCAPVGSLPLSQIDRFPSSAVEMLAAVGIRTLVDLERKVASVCGEPYRLNFSAIYETLRATAAGVLTPSERETVANAVIDHLSLGNGTKGDATPVASQPAPPKPSRKRSPRKKAGVA